MDEKCESFVQGVEVWIPDGNLLQRQSGAYKQHTQFEQASGELTLKKGQGLPGIAWSSGRPEVWHEMGAPLGEPDSGNVSQLDAAVAVPLFQGSEVTAVVMFLCGSRQQTGGCIEVWEPQQGRELVHVDGYYGRLSSFETISRGMRFPRGQGLPGITWQRGFPQIIEDIGSSPSFLRAEAARASGVHSGLGIPLHRGGAIAHVMLFLSAQSTPLARAFEVWVPDADDRLHLEQSYYAAGLESFGERSRALSFEPGEKLPGRVFETGRPYVADCSRADVFGRREGALQAGLEFALGLPIHDGHGVRAVVLLLS